MYVVASPVWTLEAALECVRGLQQRVRPMYYHVALGGGVLNKGESGKDLDLYFLPLDNGELCQPAELFALLTSEFGDSKPIAAGEYGDGSYWAMKRKFANSGRRVDVFIGRCLKQKES